MCIDLRSTGEDLVLVALQRPLAYMPKSSARIPHLSTKEFVITCGSKVNDRVCLNGYSV